MDSLNVEFDYAKAVYLPGQSVTGSVVFHLRAPESFKGQTVLLCESPLCVRVLRVCDVRVCPRARATF